MPTSLFNGHDRLMLASIALALAGAIAYATVSGAPGVALGVGLPLLGAAVALAFVSRGGTASAIGLPILGMMMVALMIHVAQGRGEAHFAVFALLACTVTYLRWDSIVAAAATIAVHHLSFNYFQQWGWGPICFTRPGLGLVVEHAIYVVVESAVLVLQALSARRDALASIELASLTDGLLAGDGRIRFNVAHEPSRSEVAGRLKASLRHIETTMEQVRGAAEAIRTATGELSGGNDDLRRRTEQAAGSLQQTAGSVAQLTGSVQHSASSAGNADRLAAGAAQAARRGGEVVSGVVSTMQEIEAASKRISDIIGVIDGIAFQTNILALNAAVEAARAGEQGRGFAVVAGEVRSLAGRAANASREIKALIDSSVAKVGDGTRLVSTAGETMDEIVASVQKVSDIIGEISSATSEQSNAIGQVNTAVSELDEATQQNAALVEENSAVATAMKDQATQLAQLMDRFEASGAR